MPIYEFECKKCGAVTSFLEKIGEQRPFWRKRRCQTCGSRKLDRIYSTFVARRSVSPAELLDEMSKIGPVNFVPRAPGYGAPPPGGCPYAEAGDGTTPAQDESG